MGFLFHIVPTMLILGVLIFVHELGHFLACRFAGVGVEKFSIGFGPELLSWQGKETRYSLSLIPFGGFVKPSGETIEEIKERGEKMKKGDFLAASVWNRFLILIAGVTMNFLFAYILFAAVLVIGRPMPSNVIGGFVAGYPAEKSGLKVGDHVTQVNGKAVSNWQDLTLQILQSKGSDIKFSVKRNETIQDISVVPQYEKGKDIFGQAKQVPRIGIQPSEEFIVERYSVSDSIVKAAQFEWSLVTLTYEALWRLITGQLSFKTISGPIGIVSMAGNAAKMGIIALMQFAAVLSVSLGVINSLPIPALDGGHLFFLAIEAVRRKALSIKIQERVTQIGFYFLMALMVLVVFNDLVNIGALAKLKSLFTPS